MEDYQALKGNINNTKIMIVFFFNVSVNLTILMIIQ